MPNEMLGMYRLSAVDSLSGRPIITTGYLIEGIGGYVTLIDSQNSDNLTFPHNFNPLKQQPEVFACFKAENRRLAECEIPPSEQMPDGTNRDMIWSYGPIRDVRLNPISLGGWVLYDDAANCPQ